MGNVFKTFNQNFFKNRNDIRWFDKQGVLPLFNGSFVLITLSDSRTHNQYDCYEIKIINQIRGTLIEKRFMFKDYLEMVHRDSSKYYHVWYDEDRFDWYISHPKNTKELVQEIMDFINLVKLPYNERVI
jgi:hypothetical protein